MDIHLLTVMFSINANFMKRNVPVRDVSRGYSCALYIRSVHTCLLCIYQLYIRSLLHGMLRDPRLIFFLLTGGCFWNACVLLLAQQQRCSASLLKMECFCLNLGFIGINKFIQVQKVIWF